MIASLLDTAARHFGIGRSAALIQAAPQAEPVALVEQPVQIPSIALIPQESRPMHFVSSPLTRPGLTAAQIDALDVAFSHPDVQRAAGRLAATRQRLAEACGFRCAIAEAIDATGAADPISLIEALDRSANEADDAIAAAREDKRRHDAQHRARMARVQPLRSAVGRRITELIQEKETLVARLAAAANVSKVSNAMGQLRYENLRASGLTNEQIAGLGDHLRSPDDVAREMHDRIAAIDLLLIPLWSFSKDPFFDEAPLEGLGFDQIVEARRAAERELT